MSTRLVVLEKDNYYTFYIDRRKIAKVQSAEPMSKETLEFYRLNHFQLMIDIEGVPPIPA